MDGFKIHKHDQENLDFLIHGTKLALKKYNHQDFNFEWNIIRSNKEHPHSIEFHNRKGHTTKLIEFKDLEPELQTIGIQMQKFYAYLFEKYNLTKEITDMKDKKQWYEDVKDELPERLLKEIEKYGLENFHLQVLDTAYDKEERNKKKHNRVLKHP